MTKDVQNALQIKLANNVLLAIINIMACAYNVKISPESKIAFPKLLFKVAKKVIFMKIITVNNAFQIVFTVHHHPNARVVL